MTMRSCARSLLGLATSMITGCGISTVTHDKFDMASCAEVVTARTKFRAEEQRLATLVQVADASPGGLLVSAMAYRTELAQTRALISAANRAIERNRCTETLPQR